MKKPKKQTLRKQRWTQEEEELLELWAECVPIELIGRRLRRSRASVRDKAHHMGLSLEVNLDYLSLTRIAKLLNCSRSALSYWAAKGAIAAKKSSPSKTSSWRVSRQAFKKFYQAHSDCKVFKNAPEDAIKWLTS